MESLYDIMIRLNADGIEFHQWHDKNKVIKDFRLDVFKNINDYPTRSYPVSHRFYKIKNGIKHYMKELF